MSRLLVLGALSLTFAFGCAASNGGGHVVGNSIMPKGTAAKMAKSCNCNHAKKDAGSQMNCKECANKKAKDAKCEGCAGETCACGH